MGIRNNTLIFRRKHFVLQDCLGFLWISVPREGSDDGCIACLVGLNRLGLHLIYNIFHHLDSIFPVSAGKCTQGCFVNSHIRLKSVAACFIVQIPEILQQVGNFQYFMPIISPPTNGHYNVTKHGSIWHHFVIVGVMIPNQKSFEKLFGFIRSFVVTRSRQGRYHCAEMARIRAHSTFILPCIGINHFIEQGFCLYRLPWRLGIPQCLEDRGIRPFVWRSRNIKREIVIFAEFCGATH
mmetsp:Transcript_35784/g.77708  ORF Transcript_35784/g.77708 Transcript_35784/m.77708 type:complete len:238 (-) Transcript_35784:438-1151(-)